MNRALSDAIFVGLIIAVFGTVILHLTFGRMDFSGEDATGLPSSLLGVFPILFGAVTGFAAGNFAYKARIRQSADS